MELDVTILIFFNIEIYNQIFLFEEGESILFFQILKSSAYNIYFPFPINDSHFLLIYQILLCMGHCL